ncbi:hypothetical protein [Mucilaginibacter terrae]|uniref:Leucine-rich repeat domain-containing protein n=1 Tax=Mucilaginibacter terrae TaxID=1955052 RepID=A0ABU3H085_9SPHI|nr:hypothetical protein [Mucilaginibacter terrae]MDT3405428.1 hypothetical protein [Mucilaginibacter terrae]
MAQSNFQKNEFYYDTYDNFIDELKNKNSFLEILGKKKVIDIYNSKTVFHTSWNSGEDLPENGIYFEHFNIIVELKSLKELRLENLFVKNLPANFINLNQLITLELCFSRSADVEKNLAILKGLKLLKYLDLNGSRLSEKQRDYIRIELSKQGVIVNDVVMLRSN